MAEKRKAYAPFSTSSEAGISAAPVEGFIQIDQEIKPTLNTGFIDRKGVWQGNTTSDSEFHSFSKDEAVPNGVAALQPSLGSLTHWPLDMTGFQSLFIAIRPSNGGTYGITAVMGPDALTFANLSPVNAAATLRGSIPTQSGVGGGTMNSLFNDNSETLTADVWNILIITEVLTNQKLLQFKVTNNSGGDSDIEIAFMRMV